MAKKLVWIFIAISIAVHIGSYWASYSLPSFTPLPSPTPDVTTVELLPLKPPDSSATVAPPLRFAEAPKELLDDSLDALRKKASTLSEKVQRVKKETRSNLLGLTRNQQLAAYKKWVADQKKIKVTSPETTFTADGTQAHKQQESNNSTAPLDLPPSTFGNHLDKSVQIGAFTALNSDRHLFYSFYARIEERIRPPWENRVTEESKFLGSNSPLRPKGGWATRIDVLLNRNGQLNKILLLKSSGIPGFDEAAILAFQTAGYFPHPPAEMVNEDGLILLKYIFTVY